ncbi:MAG: DUF6732 family protein [Pseudomonadota bacterium]
MKLSLGTLAFLLVAGQATAHVGHVGEIAGHSHWVAGAAIDLAGAIAVWAGRKAGAKQEASSDDKPDPSEEKADA